MTDLPSARRPRSSMPLNRQPPRIPGWTLLRSIGHGSYGEVWLAQSGDGLYRAIKVVYRGNFDNDRPYERELSGLRRFEPISRDHPSQVAVFTVGENTDDGFFYYVMELADDASAAPMEGPIKAEPSRRPLDPSSYQPRTLKNASPQRGRLRHQECIKIGIALATAVDHLHQHGLVHRDIKPSNVIFVDGVPKLADIGLVTHVDASISFVGTEGFLPPEGPGTPQADIYSLGKVLYEISTGQDRMSFPELPTLMGDPVDQELLLEINQVLLKACQNDLRKRYRTARELLDDLNLLREGRSIRRTRAIDARLRITRIALAIVGAVAILAFAGNHLVQQRRIRGVENEKAQEASARLQAQQFATDQSRRLADLYVATGQTLATNGDFFGALVLFQRAFAVDPPDTTRQRAHRQRVNFLLERAPQLAFVLADSNGIASARYSANGQRLLTVTRDGAVRIWNSGSGRPVTERILPTRPIQTGDFNADGDLALTLDDQGGVGLVTSPGSHPVFNLLRPAGNTLAGFSPTGRQFAVTDGNTNTTIWETAGRRERFQLPHPGAVTCQSFSPDGQLLATGTKTGAVSVRSTDTGASVTGAIQTGEAILQIAFSPEGRRLLTLGSDGVRLHDVRSGETSPHTLRHDGGMLCASFSPDGRRIVTGGEDHSARVWDAVTGQLLGSLPHSDPVRRIGVSPDQRFIVTATQRSAQLWNFASFEKIAPAFVQGGPNLEAAFSPAGHQLLTLSDDGAVRVFNLDRQLATDVINAATETPAALASWAHLLAGRHVTADEQLVAISATDLARLAEKLAPQFSGLEDENELLSWHQAIALEAETNRQWFTAAFHWNESARTKPLDSFRAERLRHARAMLTSDDAIATRPIDLAIRIPPRESNTPGRLLDLTRHYNASLNQAWLPANPSSPGNDLSSLPAGVRKFNGVEFDVRGVVQLSSSVMETQAGRFPRSIPGIPVGRTCRRLHFLHGAVWSSLAGTSIGSYVVHYEDGETQEIKIIFGRHLREWWSLPTQQPLTTGAAVAWEGTNPASTALGLRLRLFQMTWVNPRPASRIATIDFKSFMEPSAPFLIAVSTE